jgi:hypothetical protein
VVTLPHGRDTLLITAGGPNSFAFATDTTGTGHITTNPSRHKDAIVLEIPFLNGAAGIPEHDVLHEGPCTGREERKLSGF